MYSYEDLGPDALITLRPSSYVLAGDLTARVLRHRMGQNLPNRTACIHKLN